MPYTLQPGNHKRNFPFIDWPHFLFYAKNVTFSDFIGYHLSRDYAQRHSFRSVLAAKQKWRGGGWKGLPEPWLRESFNPSANIVFFTIDLESFQVLNNSPLYATVFWRFLLIKKKSVSKPEGVYQFSFRFRWLANKYVTASKRLSEPQIDKKGHAFHQHHGLVLT